LTSTLWKNRALPITWWRTDEGYYIKWTLSGFGRVIPIPDPIDVADAHRMMQERDNGTYKWYITEAEVEELIEDDKRIERKRSLGF